MIIAVITIAIMLLGTGYAYWTETLTIDNTVSTGYLDVRFIDANAWDYDNSEVFPSRGSNLVIAHKTIAADGQSITLTVENLYPGAGASLDFLIENKGTIPAKIWTVTGTVIKNQALADALDYYVDTVRFYNGSWQFYEIDPIKADTVEELAFALQQTLGDIILNPGDRLYLSRTREYPGYDIVMPVSITGDDFEDEQLIFNLGLTFSQVN